VVVRSLRRKARRSASLYNAQAVARTRGPHPSPSTLLDTAATHATCPPRCPITGDQGLDYADRYVPDGGTVKTGAATPLQRLLRVAGAMPVVYGSVAGIEYRRIALHLVFISALFSAVLRGRLESEVSIDRCLSLMHVSPVSLRLTRLTSTATAVNDWTRNDTCASVITLLLQDSVVTSSAAPDDWAAEGG
jgi:hypothetical protein